MTDQPTDAGKAVKAQDERDAIGLIAGLDCCGTFTEDISEHDMNSIAQALAAARRGGQADEREAIASLLTHEAERFIAQLKAAEAKVEVLRTALSYVEWDDLPGNRCPRCKARKEHGHHAGCEVQLALGAAVSGDQS